MLWPTSNQLSIYISVATDWKTDIVIVLVTAPSTLNITVGQF